MPKLPSFKPREVIRRFEKLGYILHHQKGSHVIMYHKNTGKRATIPNHLKDIPSGTLKAILKQTHTSEDEFLKAK